MLAVIDISGSMARGVASAGGASRLQETKDAATRGLSLYPDDAQIGLWVFSQNLTPRTDYRTLVPIGPLGVRPDGVLGRQQLGTTLAGLRVDPNGNTALYDTTLAAVRSVRKGWDPNRVNSVVLLTDGRNEDNEGISLTHLLSTLRRENDPARPIPVITIAFGPDSDRAALAAISQATGGSTYVTSNANDVYAVFQDAVGRRSCRPQC
jgi:Ca-activated chloride channel family protein